MDNVAGLIGLVLYLAIIIAWIAGMCKTYAKAGEPGWAAIIPIYNAIVLLKIVGKPIWWFILYLIPLVGFIIYIIVNIELAKKFNKGAGFGIGLSFLPFAFFPMLGFGDAQYQGSSAE